ncbi:MAG: bifunctional alpha,alpha-trehalose-phosphate synthase (UDP-forming)/trehalose-phosphatase [Myxococcota bacterium]
MARPHKLVIVSNRLPVTVTRARGRLSVERSTGGLVAALDPALRRLGGTWIGWPGIRLRPGQRLPLPHGPYPIAPVRLSETEVRRFYHGFSNRTLWPLFHSFPERTQFERRDWESYDAVNERFAEKAAKIGADADLIWIHDYQLMRCAYHLRKMLPQARIGFFLHIPFPPFDLYRTLPWYRELLRGLLACDLIGLHVPGYTENFLDCTERLLGARVDRDALIVEYGARAVSVGAFPLGIDYEAHASLARSAGPTTTAPGEQIVLGVDRLDYTKGIPDRIRSFERLLELHREHRERVVLLQLAVPSRSQVTEYQALKREIDELVGRVNGRFATRSWSPIRYLYRSVAPLRLAAMYRDAHVALVTPLRDGMNLVAKEFVACQTADPGVLILSRMAGAAETMHEALHVNPHNLDSVAAALHRALTMDVGERQERMAALQRRERKNDVHRWTGSFIEAAQRPRPSVRPTADAEFESWLGGFLERRPLALFLDYDGTLSPIVDHPSRAMLSRRMRQALDGCAKRDDTDVTIVSGRGIRDVQKRVRLEGLTIAGNHGLEIEGPGLEPFRHRDLFHYRERAEELASNLEEICPPGAWVEEKGASLTVHYRQAEPVEHARVAALARALIHDAGFQARPAHCAVEARPPIGWDKGHAVLHIMRGRYGAGWSERVRVIYAGDDVTDEDAFRALLGLGITFRVGGSEAPTLATRSLSDVSAVQTMLEWLAARPPLST